MMPLLFPIFAAFALLAWKDRRGAFLLFVAAFPTYVVRFTIAGIPTTALEVLFVILFAAWMLKRKRRLIDIRGWGWLLVAWLLVATVSLFVSPDFRAAASIWKAYFIEPVLFFLIANDLMRAQTDRDAVVRSLAVSAIGISLVAIVQHWTHSGVPSPWNLPGQERSTSVYGFPNAVGLFLAPLIPLFAGQILRNLERRPIAALYGITVLVSFVAIALAQTEGAIVGLAAGFGVFLLCFKKTRTPTLVAGSIITIALFLLPTRTFIIEKLTLNDWSGRVRKEMWVEASHMLKDHALLGAGLSGYPNVFDVYHKARHIEIFQYPHQIVLNFWSELGLAGLVAFTLLVIRYFRTAAMLLRQQRVWAAALIASMTVLLVHGLVDVPYFKNDLSMLFWLLLAFASALAAEARVDRGSRS